MKNKAKGLVDKTRGMEEKGQQPWFKMVLSLVVGFIIGVVIMFPQAQFFQGRSDIALLKQAEKQLKEGKTDVCHIPPGNPANPHSITISDNAVDFHLAHGDLLGECTFDTDPDPALVPPEVKDLTDPYLERLTTGEITPENLTIETLIEVEEELAPTTQVIEVEEEPAPTTEVIQVKKEEPTPEEDTTETPTETPFQEPTTDDETPAEPFREEDTTSSEDTTEITTDFTKQTAPSTSGEQTTPSTNDSESSDSGGATTGTATSAGN